MVGADASLRDRPAPVHPLGVGPSAQQTVDSAPARPTNWLARPTRALTHRRLHTSPTWVKHSVPTKANALTAVRLLVVVSLLSVAVNEGSQRLLIVGLLVNWAGDMADGFVARRTERETVFGAQFDALTDRLTVLLVVVGSVVIADGSLLSYVAAIFVWLQFGVVDQLIFGQFLKFDLWSPDEFHITDEEVWRLNWSPIAKLASGVPVGLLAIGGELSLVALVIALSLIALRFGCYLRIANRLARRTYDR